MTKILVDLICSIPDGKKKRLNFNAPRKLLKRRDVDHRFVVQVLAAFFFFWTPGKKEIPGHGGGEEIMLFRVFFLCCLGCQSVIFSFLPFLEGTAKGIEAGADYDSINQHIMCFFKKLMCSTFLYQNTSGNVKNYRIDFNLGLVVVKTVPVHLLHQELEKEHGKCSELDAQREQLEANHGHARRIN